MFLVHGPVSAATFPETSVKKGLILTDQVGRQGRKLLLCCHVAQALDFDGTLYIGIHNRSSHFGFLQDLLQVQK